MMGGGGHILIGKSLLLYTAVQLQYKTTAGLALTIQYYIHIEGLKEQYCKIIQVIMVTDLLFAKRITHQHSKYSKLGNNDGSLVLSLIGSHT